MSWTGDGRALLVCTDDCSVGLWTTRSGSGAVTPTSEALYDAAMGRRDVFDLAWRTELESSQVRSLGPTLQP